MRTVVRATRGYLAGFGTSGSLLAGAALLFVLGSAIVAFRGWPQIATGPATSAVAAAQPTPAPSRVARRLAVVLAGRTADLGAGAPTGGGANLPPRKGPATPGKGTSTATRGGAVSASAAAAGASGPAPCPGCGQGQTLVNHLANTVSQEVTSIGSGVGSQVGSAAGAAAGNLNQVSPPTAGAVQAAGNGAGTAVSSTATTAGNAVAQAGAALGGGGH